MAIAFFTRARSLAAALGLALFAAAAAGAQEPPPLVEFTPADAVGALSVHPREISQLPDLDFFPYEVLSASVQKHWDFDPLQIDKALILVGEFTEEKPPRIAAILRFANAQAAADIFKSKRTDAKLDPIDGKKRVEVESNFQLLFLDDKTVAVGDDASLNWIVGAAKEGKGGVLVDLLKKAPHQHLSLNVHVTPVAPALAAIAGALPEPLPKLASSAPQINLLQADVDFRLQGQVRIELTAKDKEGAAELGKILQAQAAFFADIYGEQLSSRGVSSNLDPLTASWIAYLRRSSERLVELAKPKVDGDKVVVAIKNDRVAMTTLGIVASNAVSNQIAAEVRKEFAEDRVDLRNLILALHNYHSSGDGFPARVHKGKDGKGGLSWRVHLLPYLDQQELYDQFHLDEPWDSEHNKKLIAKMPAVFRSKGDPADSTTTRYQAVIAKGALFEEEEPTSLVNVTDGTSTTVAIVQTAKDKAVIWTKPDDFTLDEKDPHNGLVEPGARGFLAGFADGSVSFLPETTKAEMIRAIVTKAGGEVVEIDRQ